MNKKQIYIFLLVVVFVKIFFSFFIELGNDESYYYTYALQPQLNYFDHPPMVGFLIRLTTLNLHFVNDVTLRLGSIICCVIASFFIYKTTFLLSNKTAAWYAVLLYNFSIYTTVIAGFFILPDSIQMPFWCAAIWQMSNIVFNKKENGNSAWLWLGLIIGIAILCKIHSLYLWAGFGLYIIFYHTKWLLNWRLYISFLISALCCLPILIWNIQNNFITYKFHSNRVAHTQVKFDSFTQEIIGEALYQNPIIYILIVIALVVVIRKISKQNFGENTFTKNHFSFLLFLSVPMIFLFWGISLFNDILPHWSGPAFIPLYIIAAIYLSNVARQKYPATIAIAGFLLLSVFVATTIIIHFYPSNFGSKDIKNYGEGCPTLDISGWKNMSEEFYSIYKKDVQEKKVKNPVILVNNWFPACQLQLYTATKTGLNIIGIGDIEKLHQFAWLNKKLKPLQVGNDAYAIVPSNQPINVQECYGQYFAQIQQPQYIQQLRKGKVVRNFYIYRLINCLKVPQSIL